MFADKEKKSMKNKLSKRIAKVAAGVSMAAQTMFTFAFMAFADGVDIDTNYTLNSNVGNVNPESLVIGLALWISRLIGTGMLIWGIYGYVTARKDGEAESMNGALGKLISGLVLICMPSVLKGLGVI